MPRYPAFVGGSYQSQSPLFDCERTVNWYVERKEVAGQKSDSALYPTPGQALFGTTDEPVCRGMRAVNDHLYAVVGEGLFEVLSDGSVSKNTTLLATDNYPAVVSYAGAAVNGLAIASGGNVYVMDLTTKAVTTELTGTYRMVGEIDGYVVAFNAATPQIEISALNDATTWDPTQYAQRGTAPDPWQAMLCADRLGRREVWLIGTETGDVYYDSGAYPFPLAPIPGSLFKYGIRAAFSLAAPGGRPTWLSQNADGAGIVVSANGYIPEPISNKAVEGAIARYQRDSLITDAEGFSLQIEGHIWYVLRFPSAKATWCYDFTTNTWFELGTWSAVDNDYLAWDVRCHAYAFGKHIAGLVSSGTLVTLDVTNGTELDGSPIRRVRQAPALCDERRMIQYPRFELYVETGEAPQSGAYSDPSMMLQMSKDGGRTWGPAWTMRVGKAGETTTRVYRNRLGWARDGAFRVICTDVTPRRIVDAFLNNTAPRGQ